MRNYRNQERDKLPVLYVPAYEPIRVDPYVARMQWRATVTEAALVSALNSVQYWKETAQMYWSWYCNAADKLPEGHVRMVR